MDLELLRKPIKGISPSKYLTPEACNQLQIHAMEAYPEECVGYICKGEYVRLENVSPSPEGSAKVDAVVLQNLLADGKIEVFCHSHPDGPDCPSAHDLRGQYDMDLPWAIVSTNGKGCLPPFIWGSGIEKPPVLGRGFRHGLEDCYGLIRDFYDVVFDVQLEDFPRDWEWWKGHKDQIGEGLYEQNFAKWGFSEVHDELQVGDVFLLRAASEVPNHAGVYVGQGLMLHHLSGRMAADASRISTIEPVVRWQTDRRLVKVVRHGGLT